MDFTPEQARTLAGVSRETLRHWRRAVPYLSGKAGKAARFTLTDVVGLAVIQEVVEKLGIQIASVGHSVDVMFGLLANATADSLDSCTVTLAAEQARLHDQQEETRGIVTQPSIVVPLAPLIARIQQNLFPIATRVRQRDLRFPPEAVRRQA
jgi:hypothetical protein